MLLLEIGSIWPVDQQITFASPYVAYLFLSVTMVSGTLFILVTVWNMSTGVEPWSGVMSTSSSKPHFLFRHRLLFILQFPFVCRIAFFLLCFLSCQTLPFFWFVLLLLDWPFSFRFAFNHQALLLFLGVFEWSNWRRRSRFGWLIRSTSSKSSSSWLISITLSGNRWWLIAGMLNGSYSWMIRNTLIGRRRYWFEVLWVTGEDDWLEVRWVAGTEFSLSWPKVLVPSSF